MPTKDELKAELDARGIEYTEDMTKGELEALLVESEPSDKPSDEPSDEPRDTASFEKGDDSKCYYFVKYTAYADEKTRLPMGLYYMEPNERFDRLPVTAVERFDELTDAEVDDIATKLGVKTFRHEGNKKVRKSAEELLSQLVKNYPKA